MQIDVSSAQARNIGGVLTDGRLRSLQQGAVGETSATAAKKMEALFATMLVKELRRALPNGFFGKDSGADTFNGWFDEHIGESLAKTDALGLAGMIKTAFDSQPAENGGEK